MRIYRFSYLATLYENLQFKNTTTHTWIGSLSFASTYIQYKKISNSRMPSLGTWRLQRKAPCLFPAIVSPFHKIPYIEMLDTKFTSSSLQFSVVHARLQSKSGASCQQCCGSARFSTGCGADFWKRPRRNYFHVGSLFQLCPFILP
jgi:hypothetical protein